ncbi:ankyrin repeat domain-containing protein [Thalassococcus sp. CAU 1522]|uniref:Ankyrin repeat domain-containing protein n=1 Tax=Thalassococcus arenae TaxID=2851652 RepID=A0ABS6N4T6_9RHOB|nr:ankyrin repeat domain-containing protein [Thalassococcus arenae]MBV2358697.1 ankyrin repeat domain-containing protein [Thalassococcus arenae]
MTELSLDDLRREAKKLHRAFATGDVLAVQRVKQARPRDDLGALKHADFLHVIAQEQKFGSWPRLKLAVEMHGMNRAARLQRLRIALFHGQNWQAEALLADDPDLAGSDFGLACALYDIDAVRTALANKPALAVTPIGPRRPILHLAFSRWHKARPELKQDMIAVAEALVSHGADVNDGFPVAQGDDHLLSALYGAIGHGDNMALGRWLLAHGADPNDGESLYHATELGHHDGLRMLLAAGARPKGTNALLRAMDFHDHAAVGLLLAHGADPNEFDDAVIGGETPWVIPALHQAARRMCDRRMADLLLDAGADPQRRYQGAHPYAFARIFGNRAVAAALEARGAVCDFSSAETLLVQAAEGQATPGAFVDPAGLPDAYDNLIRVILHLPEKSGHVRRLVDLGLPYDQPDSEGLTPVQVAGWEGLPDMMDYLLSLRPDLTHVNGYGGTLLSTIIHGSENNPQRWDRDHLDCLRRALEHGVALPRQQIDQAGREDVAMFLTDWAETHPGQVV